MERLNVKLQAQQYTTTRCILPNCKNNRPMADLPTLIGLQEANGLEIGQILEFNHACTDSCQLIARVMPKNLVKYTTQNDLGVGFMTDDSTTISKKQAVIICSCCRLPGSRNASGFFDLIELDNTRAASTVETFLSNQFEDEFLLRNWI
jgi:hypothetical protein